MLTLNVNYVCQVGVIRKKFAFTETWIYDTKLHDPNKRKVGLPCFEQTSLLNGMKMSWYSMCSFLFFYLEPTFGKDTWMGASSVNVYGDFFESAILKVTCSQLSSKFLLKNCEVH